MFNFGFTEIIKIIYVGIDVVGKKVYIGKVCK